jgi:hypothetical protein
VEGVDRRIVVQSCTQVKIQDPIWKTTKAKQIWGISQVAEHLPIQHEDVSSNPNTTKKKKLMINDKCYNMDETNFYHM